MFLLFRFDTYYPAGGAKDVKGLFATVEAAYESLGDDPGSMDNAHVYHVDVGRIVAAWAFDRELEGGWKWCDWTMENYG